MAAVTVPNAGTYDLLVDVGFLVDGLVLDDPVRGVLGGYVTSTTRTNLSTNPSVETNSTAWVGGTGVTVSRSTVRSYIGTASVEMAYTSATADPPVVIQPGLGSHRIPVVTGQSYAASVYVYTPDADDYRMDIRWATAVTGGSILDINGSNVAVPGNTWTRLTITGTCPVGYSFAQFNVYRLSNTVTGSTWVDAFLVETGSTVLPYFDGTTAAAYTGYTLTAQQWNGTTNNSTSTATWGLNSSFYAGNPLDGSTSFASVAEGTLNVSVKRGRQDENDAFTNGTMVFTLNDTLADGVFNPFDDDPSNPYYDQAAGVPGLAPGRQVQLIRYDDSNVAEPLFVGFIVNYDYKFTLGGLDTVTVFCVDNMYRLAQTFIPGQNPSKEFTGDRINWVLDLPEVDYPSGSARNIDPGTVELGGSTQYAIPDGQNVKAYFDQITYGAERGRIFIDRSGVFVSQDRIGFVVGPAEIDFRDDGTGTPYRDLSIAFRAEDIINRVEVVDKKGDDEVAEDLASQATYFIKTLFINDSLIDSATQAQDLANYLLYPEPLARFDAVETWYGSLTSTDRDAASILDIGSYITIEKEILIGNTPSPLAQDLSIEGIEHRIDFARGHSARYYTSPAQPVYDLILDDPVYGILDANNVLG